jgi:ABC-type multidrug transport system ATPase subunit
LDSITLENTGIRFNQEWIFRKINNEFTANEPTVVLGGNGSGKSTLLKLIAGYNHPSEGIVKYNLGNSLVPVEQVYNYVSFASPYLELIEEFTLLELIQFHFTLKKSIGGLDAIEIIQLLKLEGNENKVIKNFSSGMRQRVKVGLALFTDAPILLLDEPTSNFDKKNIDWYQAMLNRFKEGRIIIICSNHQLPEYEICKKQLVIDDYKAIKAAPISLL